MPWTTRKLNAMNTALPKNETNETGMELRDLLGDSVFRSRSKQARNPNRFATAFRHFSKMLAEDQEPVLQELVQAAVELCGADSAGISLEEPEKAPSGGWPSPAALRRIWMDGQRETTALAVYVWIQHVLSFTASPNLITTI